MKTKKVFLKSFVLIISMVFMANQGFSQEKKAAVIKIKTSVVCGMCKDRVEQGLAYEKGIKDVKVDLETKTTTVRYAALKTNPDQIRKMISKLGYDADSIPADKVAYSKLPACCKKDVPKH